jgi:hypothetical protein
MLLKTEPKEQYTNQAKGIRAIQFHHHSQASLLWDTYIHTVAAAVSLLKINFKILTES